MMRVESFGNWCWSDSPHRMKQSHSNSLLSRFGVTDVLLRNADIFRVVLCLPPSNIVKKQSVLRHAAL